MRYETSHFTSYIENRSKTNLATTLPQNNNKQIANTVKSTTTNSNSDSIAAIAIQPKLNNQNSGIVNLLNLQTVNSQNITVSVPTQVLLATALINMETVNGSKK